MQRQDYILIANELLKELQEHSDETDAQHSDRIARVLEACGVEEYKIGFLAGSACLGATHIQ